jgi:hypothetical protein
MVTNNIGKKEIKQQHQSESITFRLDSSILNKLHHEAEQKLRLPPPSSLLEKSFNLKGSMIFSIDRF